MNSLLTKKQTNFTVSSRHSFEDLSEAFRLSHSQSQNNFKAFNPKMSLLQINKEKVKKRNNELLKLFKPTPPQQFNIDLLQKSQLMRTSEIYYYLVKCLKKQRQGMISVSTIEAQRLKDPKPIENKIRQFLYHSLQQTLLMSEKQIEETKVLEKLFLWFTDVFKEREMKLSFKKQSVNKGQKDAQDQDWLIRNTYKSNMPLELGNYQRKLLNMTQIDNIHQRINKNHNEPGQDINLTQEGNDRENQNTRSLDPIGHCLQEKKLYSQSMMSSPKSQKAKQILPILNKKSLLSKLANLRQDKQNQQFKQFESQWKKSRAQYLEHASMDFLNQSKMKYKNINDKFIQTKKSNSQQSPTDKPSFLSKTAVQKIQAARLGVTFTDFRKNKETLLKDKTSTSCESPVFHPYLTSNYFYQIKKKNLQNLRKKNILNGFKYKSDLSKTTEESEDISANNIQLPAFGDESFEGLFMNSQEVKEETLNNIDGMGLAKNPHDKVTAKHKKK